MQWRDMTMLGWSSLPMLDDPRSFKQSCFTQRLSGRDFLVKLHFSSGKQEDIARKW